MASHLQADHPDRAMKRESGRAFDLQRRERNAVCIAEHLIRRSGLTIDADQIAVGMKRADVPLEHLLDGGVFWSFNVVGVTTGVIADEQYLHV